MRPARIGFLRGGANLRARLLARLRNVDLKREFDPLGADAFIRIYWIDGNLHIVEILPGKIPPSASGRVPALWPKWLGGAGRYRDFTHTPLFPYVILRYVVWQSRRFFRKWNYRIEVISPNSFLICLIMGVYLERYRFYGGAWVEIGLRYDSRAMW